MNAKSDENMEEDNRRLKEQGLCETIPKEPEMDEKGLYMKLTVPKNEVLRILKSATNR